MRRPLVQNRNEEEWTLVHSDEWRFPLGRVAESKCLAGLFVSQSGCSSISVISAGSAKPIRPAEVSKDAPEIGNDDGVGHVAPRVTCDPPRAAA